MEGQLEIYVMSAEGGRPIRLTTDPGVDWRPYWSRDGKWIYFTSSRTGQFQVWKILADGNGSLTQVTRNGGTFGMESEDLKWFFYNKDYVLWRMPLGGSEGEARKVVSNVIFGNFTVTPPGVHPRGLYYVRVDITLAYSFSINFYDFAAETDHTLCPSNGVPYAGLSLSPDGRYLLYAQADKIEGDIILVENFR